MEKVHADECPPSNTLYDQRDIQLEEDSFKKRKEKKNTLTQRKDGHKQEKPSW